MNRSQTPDRRTLVVFGDQTSNVSNIARQLLLGVPQSAAATEFLRDASAALMAQKGRLRPFQRDILPDFKNIHDMARMYDEANGLCHPSITSVMLCTVQLLQLFRYFEEHGVRPNENLHVTAVGLCTGSLAAAAFAASKGVEDLKCLAVPTISMAFQLGLQAATASSMLYNQDGANLGSWSVAIPNMSEEEALSALSLHDAGHHLSLRHRCFVSAVGLKSVTVSGAPPALKAFTATLTASQPERRTIELPIAAAFHAIHIHPFLDFTSFLSRCGISPVLLARFKPAHTFLSSLTGEPIVADAAFGLFKTAVCETLQAPLRLDLIVERFSNSVRAQEVSSVTVEAVSPTSAADGIVAALSQTHASVSSRPIVALAGEHRSNPSFNSAPLAIVGMSGRFPDADTAEALWELLAHKVDTHREIPKDRFDVSAHVDPSGKAKNTSWTPYGCFINRPGEFDPRFFNMSPKEALQTDPMQRLALVTAYEALEQAGFVPDRTRSSASYRVGTFYGQTSDDYRDVNSAQDIGTYFITGGIRAFGPGRINYYFKFSGPSYSVDTACSSSLAAIQLACTAIWNGECDTAIAGGLSVLTSPDLYSGLSRGQFLSKTGSCKTFDNAADGYCRADGIGTVVLKRLKDAQSDRDNVLATILGAATNHSAQAISITHPHAATQSDLYRQVLQQAGVDPHHVSYVEMHGTGTQAGDGTEMKSVTDVFAPASPKARARDNPLYVGAIKANVGHGEASSGVISLIKAMTILNKSQIPPHAGIKGELNAGFPDLKARNVRIASCLTPFPETKGKKKTILVNNFSAAGGNTALLIQEPPETPVEQNANANAQEPRTAHPVTVSGHTQSALLNNLDRLIAFLESHAETSLLDLSYTTTARRRHHSLRATVVESSTAQILQSLQLKRASLAAPDASPKKLGSVVFMFTGQGAAYPALARDIYNTSTQFRADVSHFDGIARQQGFPSFLAMITDASLADINNLSPTQTQIGLVCIQVALARLWSSFGVKPSAVVGHSLGEYAALQVAGVLSVSDMILLVGARARLLESKCERNTHSMLAVAAPASSVASSVGGEESLDGVDLACANTPRECVYAGEKAAIERLAHKLSEAGIRSTQLRVPYAFHSAQVDGILDDFGKIASVVNMGVPHTTVISPTSGKVLEAGAKLGSDYLLKHCRQTVQFEQAIKQSCAAGIITDETAVLEIGPHPVCSGMVRSTLGGDTQTLPTLNRKESPWNVIVGSLASLHDAGLTVNWSEYQRDFEAACRLILLPSYAFDNKNYWLEYRNNWTLRKGEPAVTAAAAAAAAIKSESSRSRRISSSVHRVAEEDYTAAQPEVVFETDLSDLDMHTAVSGHRVNGSALCPSSLYADIALTIAKHIRGQPSSGLDQDGHDVCDMQVTQPLIINPHRDKEDRTLRITARIDKARSILSLVFSSCGPTTTPVKHAECRVEFGNPQAWSRRWSHDLHLVNDRIAGLKARAHSGTVSSITKKLAYRLFGNLVDYAPDYQRMSQVWLDSAGLEAAAVVALDRREADAGFGFSPYHLDGLLHLSGFVMNGNDAVDASEAVYISHGWQSLRVAETLEPDLAYSVYVKMIAVDKTMVAGNVYVVRNDKIVAFCKGLRFQRVPRAVLDMLLPPQPRRQTVSAPERRKASPTAVEAPPDRLPLPVERELRGPPAQATAITTSAPPSPSQSKAILQVIANELGLVEEDLKVSDRLSDLGIDSLMSLALTGQLAERFGVHVHHFELMQCVTIQDLVDILLTRHEPELQHAASLGIEHLSGSGSSSSGSSGSSVSAAPPGNVTPPTRAPTPTPALKADGVERLLYDIILQETGMEADDFQTSTALSDLGVDSLMSLAILARLREAGLDVSPTIFLDNHTVDDVFRVLGKGTDADALQEQEEAADEATLQEPKSFSAGSTPPPQAQCILLQKASRPSSKQRSLFLFPDGSGSPSAYAALETLDATLNVYGLVCPFVKTPSAFAEHGIEGTAAVYIKTLQAMCPAGAGDLLLGGWSVGGVLAYDAARQLSEIHGRQVDGLVLIDAPCPLTLPPMNKRLIRYLDSLHLFATQSGQRDTEKHRLVLEHFDATVASLGWYKPAPITTAIRTCIVWARDGVAHGDGTADPTLLLDDPIAKWILQGRENLGAFGWDGLLPKGGLELFTTAGDHFSMMGSNVGALSSGLRHILKNN